MYNVAIVRADEINWISTNPTARVRSDLPSPVSDAEYRGCVKQKIDVAGVDFIPSATQEMICVYQTDGFRYGVLERHVYSGCCSSYYDTSFLVSYPGDTKMYRVAGMPTRDIVPTINSKHVIWREHKGYGYNFNLKIIKNFREKLTRVTNGFSVSYELKEGVIESLLDDEDNNPVTINEANTSQNGQWLATELRSGGLARINLSNFEVKRFSNYTPVYGQGSDGHIEFSVSDSGRYIATVGLDINPHISDLDGNCGITRFELEPERNPLIDPCPETNITSVIDNTIGGNLRTVGYPKFSYDGGELTVYTRPYYRQDAPYEEKWVTLTTRGYQSPRLDYLALGDSYSSGEGDTEVDKFGYKYYRSWTDNEENKGRGIPREKCHISTRSYPYLLAKSMDLALDNPKSWDTVACSGAKIWDIKEQASSIYEGQEKQLIGFDMNNLKTKALNEFIPGRQKQIEFVKKYKPKVITLTMGGNDIGFADKIKKCLFFPKTCEYAMDESRSLLASEIKDQFDSLRSLYNDLYLASGSSSKIYILGYPQFINNNENASCGTNTGFIDTQERQMMTAGVSFLNNVIEKAAEASGVKYINIEDSLDGHKLCDSEDVYVTGVAAWDRSENQESFHPNSKGNSAIASYIWNEDNLNGKSLLDYDICPSSDQNTCPDSGVTKDSIQVPSYFQSSQTDLNVKSRDISSKEVKQDIPTDIFLESHTLLPGSTVRVVLYSDPVELGQFIVNQDGSLTSTIIIPSTVPAGYHTITIKGSTYSGDLIEYEQIVRVLGLQDSDIDEDGISDNIDKCFFLPALNIDTDLDSIDDACDPVMDAVSTLQNYNYANNKASLNNKEIPDNSNSEDSINERISLQPLDNEDIRVNKEKSQTFFDIPIIQADIKNIFIYTLTVIALCALTAIILISKTKIK